MFNKKTCNKCGKNISKNYTFCPKCGNRISFKDENEWGMIGRNDLVENSRTGFPSGLFGGFGGKMLNQMINSTIKMLEKEMQKSMHDMNQDKNIKHNFELYINGKRISPDKIKVTNKPAEIQQIKKNGDESENRFFSPENRKKFLELEKKEPETNLRRLSNRIIYEISLPGVKSIEDISIIKVEKGIEIKAISKERAYSKNIPLSLNIEEYKFSKEKLILELRE